MLGDPAAAVVVGGARGSFRIETATQGMPLLFVIAAFHVSPDCTGSSIGTTGRLVWLGDTGGAWRSFAVAGFSSAVGEAQSVRIRFRIDAGGESLLQAGLDRLHFGETVTLFEDGFESGDTSAWSSTVPWRVPDWGAEDRAEGHGLHSQDIHSRAIPLKCKK